jgi:hypothetical protein
MKVLYIDHVEADYLAAIVYLGLCQELGADNVVDWPWKDSYHGRSYEGPVPYPSPGSWGIANPFSWMPAQETHAWRFEEVFGGIGSFDLVILASPRTYNMGALETLLSRVGRGAIRKLIFMDGEDYTTIRWDVVERFRPEVYFKLSMTSNPFEIYTDAKARVASTTRLVPISLASPLEAVPAAPKDTDLVFFGGSNWRPRRQEGVAGDGPSPKAALEARLRQEFLSFQGGSLGYKEYIDALSRAKIAVCVGGSGLEPLRTYEILSCPDTLLVRENIDVISACPFMSGVDHVGFDGADIDGLVRTIQFYLSNEPERQKIAATGNRFLKEHHTPRARARYLLSEAVK